MTSSPATSRPRIPRRGSAESQPAAQIAEPPRRRTAVRANAAHVVPFDESWHDRADDIPVAALLSDSPGGYLGDGVPPRPRRTALLVGVPVILLTVGLAAVALGASGRSGAPAGADGADGADGDGISSGPLGGAAVPAATGLDTELERRFAGAVEAASADGIEMTLTSGWRSAEDQAALVELTLAKHGSAEEAHRWVLPPERSAHVAGLAIDVGPTDGALWLEQHGAEHGLCRVYANELWHFEPAVEPGGTCPDLLPDSSSGWDGIDG